MLNKNIYLVMVLLLSQIPRANAQQGFSAMLADEYIPVVPFVTHLRFGLDK